MPEEYNPKLDLLAEAVAQARLVDKDVQEKNSTPALSVNSIDDAAITACRITARQIQSKRTGKYLPSVRPNFWIPVLFSVSFFLPYCFLWIISAWTGWSARSFEWVTSFASCLKNLTSIGQTESLIAAFLFFSLPTLVGVCTTAIMLKRRGEFEDQKLRLIWAVLVGATCYICLTIARNMPQV